jgi:carboxyl-terminal processing protease
MKKYSWILAFTALSSLSSVSSSFAADANDVVAATADDATELATADKADKAASPAAPTKPARESISMKDIQTFTAVMRAIQDTYVEQTDSHKLIESAIRGMLSGLDPHSEYLDASSLQQLDEQTAGEYAGLGVEVVAMDGVLRVISPIDDSPAFRAGVKAGDSIVRVDGKVGDAGERERLRREPARFAGSQIALTLRREGQDEPVEVSLTREVIKVSSVKGRMLEAGYAYVRVSQFQQETGSELREKLRGLAGKGSLKGLVLDLRSNPGGIINSAVEVSDAFLDDGLIVTTRGRVAESESTYSAMRGDLLGGRPGRGAGRLRYRVRRRDRGRRAAGPSPRDRRRQQDFR